jgi:phosphoribosylamine--glycine ligase
MKVLVVGSGGREAALAWWLRQSPRISQVLCAPGNGGTPNNRPVASDDIDGLLRLVMAEAVDLVVVGPEAPLVAGLVDRLVQTGVAVFGPSAAAARLEGSKSWAKSFMVRWNLPTAASATFTDVAAAGAHLRTLASPPVVKASGLAAGKGVVVPETFDEALAAARAMLVDGRFGSAGAEIVLEERLVGPEVSVLAVCSGQDYQLLLPAKDHKRLLDADLGPNTGGMGAVAPSPLPPGVLEHIEDAVIRPTLKGLEAEGSPYLGVLYAGLMLTEDGPRVLEFNCRLGDPETQVILPLLASDPVDVLEGTLSGRVPRLQWHAGSAVGVVLAAPGYPERATNGLPVNGVEAAEASGCLVFHAGTARSSQGRLVTAGGRVLTVTGRGSSPSEARAAAYAGTAAITLEGGQWRKDIGA